MALFRDKYRIESSRLFKFDYTRSGAYFITIRLKNYECPLGKFAGTEMKLSDEGRIVKDCWLDLPQHYSNIELDDYVIMPDHFHGIILIKKRSGDTSHHGLPEFVRAFKSFSSRKINLHHGENIGIWQGGYYDICIKSDNQLEKIRNYIRENPIKWLQKHHLDL